jgi:hypothetical protein
VDSIIGIFHLLPFALVAEEENVDFEENVSGLAGTPNGQFVNAQLLKKLRANVAELRRTVKRGTSNSCNIHCFIFCRFFCSRKRKIKRILSTGSLAGRNSNKMDFLKEANEKVEEVRKLLRK